MCFNTMSLQIVAAIYVGIVIGTEEAWAGDDFSTIAQNMISSIEDLPKLLTGLAYILGILLGTIGILKVKDHIESPQSEKLAAGAIRLAAGGGLFALPIVIEAMRTTIGEAGMGVSAPRVQPILFN